MRFTMLRFTMLTGLILSFYGTLLSQERLVISQWLTSPVLDDNYPVFHETANINGKAFTSQDLLKFNHISLETLQPEPGAAFMWPGMRGNTWQVRLPDENGYVFIADQQTPDRPQLAYTATYIKANRWIETQLEIKSPYMFEVWIDGKRIGAKNSLEKEENTIGKFSQTLKLTRGTHLLVIKTLRPPEEGLSWKVMASFEIKEPYQAGDILFSLSPQNIKNINHVLDGIKTTSVTPSPDGKLYAVNFSRSLPPSDQSETWTDIMQLSDNRLVHSFRHARLGRLSWLPASNAVSYTITRDSKATLYYHHMETGEQRILLEDEENFSGFRWAPDESYIIYTLREDGTGSDANMRHILQMEDRQPQWRNRSFLYKLDIATGVKTRLTHGNLSTSLADISPDSKKLLVGLSWPDYKEQPYSKQRMLMIDLITLNTDTLFSDVRWGVRASFSPDGKYLLATAGPAAFDGAGLNIPEGTIPNNNDTQVYLYELNTGNVECITLDFDPSVSSAYWHPLTNQIYLLAVDREYQRIYRYDPRRKNMQLIDTGLDFVSAMQISDRGHVLTFLGNQANSPRKAYYMDLKNLRIGAIEDPETDTYRHVEFGKVQKWDFTASSGVRVEGRYYLPPDFDPGKKYPVIVYYYGGTTPVGRTFAGRYPFNLWAGNGYIVYVLQPSGAIGYGQPFSAAHVNNWGITVADEIIEGTQKFLAEHPFTNPDKVGCAGASYGGFMTMLLMTRTNMFTAAISHAGISSISSYWGEGYWGYSYSAGASTGSFPWNNKDLYIGQSPLFYADKVNTPLLLLTGDSDTNVPPGESIQMYTALKLLGKPVELVMVKGEDHHILTYNKRILWHNTIMAWWDRYLKDQPEYWFDQYPEKNY